MLLTVASTALAAFALSSLPKSTMAQDPATGWMAYAVGDISASNADRITKLQMKWKVGEKAKPSFAFYSPWFGMDPSDNLNLVQPVNPWSGYSWSMYTEYFQWSPTHNSNSAQRSVEAGQTLFGSIEYLAESDSYNLTQTVVETGVTSQQIVKCQNGKKYTVPYVVYEKTWACHSYPPDEKVTFYDIVVECDGQDCTDDVQWSAKVKDANCDMAAHIDSQREISLTWSTTSESRFDNMTREEAVRENYNGWALNVVDFEAALGASSSAPSGSYCTATGAIFDGKFTVKDASHLDLSASVFGVKFSCPAEQFAIDSKTGKITLPGGSSPSDCVGKVLSNFGVSLSEVDISYVASTDELKISAMGQDIEMKKCT